MVVASAPLFESIPLLSSTHTIIFADNLGGDYRSYKDSNGISILLGGVIGLLFDPIAMVLDYLPDGKINDETSFYEIYKRPFQFVRDAYEPTGALAKHLFSKNSGCGKSFYKSVDIFFEAVRRRSEKPSAEQPVEQNSTPSNRLP